MITPGSFAPLIRIRLRQRDLQLGDALVGCRHHQKDQDDEQNVDQRNEVDLGIIFRSRAAEIHAEQSSRADG